MFIGVGFSCPILYSVVSYLYVSFSGLISSVGEYAELFYCGTPWAFHIIIL